MGAGARRADRLQTKLALVAEAVGLGNESVDRDRERGRDGYLLPTVKAVVAERDSLRTAFEGLLSVVVEQATIAPGGSYVRNGELSAEHRIWALCGEWSGGAESVVGARAALKDVIRAALVDRRWLISCWSR